MSFAVVLEGMSIVAYLIILSGGKRLRESGWKVLSLLIVLSVIVQAASMSIVVRFDQPGWLRNMIRAKYLCFRPICTTMTRGFSPAGDSMSPGFIVPLAGVLACSVRPSSLLPVAYCPQKVATS